MNTAVINIKIDSKTKTQAQKIAEDLGLNLSSVINAYLKQLIRTKTVTFSTSDEEPTNYLLSLLKTSKEEIDSGKVSPVFDNAESAVSWLKDNK